MPRFYRYTGDIPPGGIARILAAFKLRQTICYHYLCAAVTHAYAIDEERTRNEPPSRQDYLEFSRYTAYQLDKVTLAGYVGPPLPPPKSNAHKIRPYVARFTSDWRCREGGILRCTMEEREFWELIMSFHSEARTTGIPQWDDLLIKMELEGCRPGIVPCMVSLSSFTSMTIDDSQHSSHFFSTLQQSTGVTFRTASFCTTRKRVEPTARASSINDVSDWTQSRCANPATGTIRR